MLVRRIAASVALTLVLGLGLIPSAAFADDALGDASTPNVPKTSTAQSDSQSASPAPNDSTGTENSDVAVSEDATSASMEGESFAVSDFSRAQKGSNRAIDGTYYGYSYLVTKDGGIGSYLQLIACDEYAVAYIPVELCQKLGIDPDSEADQAKIKAYLCALDNKSAAGASARGTSPAIPPTPSVLSAFASTRM